MTNESRDRVGDDGVSFGIAFSQLSPVVRIPQSAQYSVSFGRQVTKTTTVSLSYTGGRGYSLFRSRDVNAPLPPLYLTRPDPAYGQIRQVESNGRQRVDSLGVMVRGRMTAWFNGQVQYTLSRTYNDTAGVNAFPANDYDLSGEWARADFDRRHRFVMIGKVTRTTIVDLGVALTSIPPAVPHRPPSRDRPVRTPLDGG